MMNDIALQALKRAISTAGSQSALARMLGTSQQRVWHWEHKSGRCPAEMVLQVEAATGISRYDLRPDIYPREEAA